MPFEANVVISAVLLVAAFLLDWPRALVGLIFGAISRHLPYGTIVVPVGVVVIAAAGEFVYPVNGRTTEPSLRPFSSVFFRSRQRLRTSI